MTQPHQAPEAHICGNRTWCGDESRALAAALQSGPGSVVITAAGADAARRVAAAGVTAAQASMRGLFATIRLSRIIRHLPADCHRVGVHTPALLATVRRAVEMSGRADMEVTLPDRHSLQWPVVADSPVADAAGPWLWMGTITADCGLDLLIEAVGRLERPVPGIRVVGQGVPRVVMPLVKRTRALGVDRLFDWRGYSPTPFDQMRGCSCAIVTRRVDPDSHSVCCECRAAGVPVVIAPDVDELITRLNELP